MERYIYKRAVLIGVDGAGAFFKETSTPNIDRIFEKGAKSYEVLTAIPTISAECWGAMLIGVEPEYHRLTNAIVSEKAYDTDSPFPTVFRDIRGAYRDAELASFCNWWPISTGIVESNLNVHTDTDGDEALTEKICAYLKDHDPKFLFVQFDGVDAAGHSEGYGTQAHLNQITVTDGYIGKIFDTLETLGRLEDTLFIVTADHGGALYGYSHGGVSDEEKYVFYALRGKNVKPGTIKDMRIIDNPAIVLYALGAERHGKWHSRIPDNVFEGVENQPRPCFEGDDSGKGEENKNPAPQKDITEIFPEEDITAFLPFEGDTKAKEGSAESSESGKLYFVDGYYGKALRLDDGYVTLKNLSFGGDKFSFAFWIKCGEINTSPFIFGNDALSLRFKDGGLEFTLCGERVSAPLPADYADRWLHVIVNADLKKAQGEIIYDFENKVSVSFVKEMICENPFAGRFNLGQDAGGEYPEKLSAKTDDFIILADTVSDEKAAALKEYYGAQ